LHRLIVKLSFSCGKLPSSLCIEGVEQTGQRPVAAGGFADIYKAVYRSNNVALKKLRLYQISTDQTTQKIREKFCQEALLWKNLKHPFIVPLIGLVSNESELNERDSEPLSMAMVCPWMPNGTIIQYLKSGQSPKVDVFLPEIAQGLCYLHSQTLVHGDLRGNHILVDEEGHARLTDFGLASFADATAKSSSRAGSGRWMAPELLDPEPHQFRRTPATDVYAFACVCYELYNGAPPFSEIPSDGAVLLNVIAGKRPGRLAPTRIPPRIWEVIQACWCQDPKDRLSTVEIVENLEKIQEAEKLHRLAEASTSSPESLGVYKAPRSSGISHRESVNSMLSLARTPSLLVDILTPVWFNWTHAI
ncbi:kinase-like domain-containing protein, partial [Mycena capillaripes]